MNNKSPLFRFNEEPKVQAKGKSPLFASSFTETRSNRQETAIVRQGRASRPSLLPTVFRESIADSQDSVELRPLAQSSHATERGRDEQKDSRHSYSNRPSTFNSSVSRSWSTDTAKRTHLYWRAQFEARKTASKHTLLSEIEVIGTCSIWILLLFPVVCTFVAVVLHSFIKWDHHELSLQRSLPLGNSTGDASTFSSPVMEKYQGFIRTHMHFQFHNATSVKAADDPFISVSSYIKSASQEEVVHSNLQLFPLYIMREFVGPGPYNASDLIKVPLPFISKEDSVPMQDIAPWQLVVNVSTASVVLADCLSVVLETSSLSRTYFYVTLVESVALCIACMSLLVVFCYRLRRHAFHAFSVVSRELPYLYQRQLTSWHFVLPEQYAVVAALLLLLVWCNPCKSVAFLTMAWRGSFYDASPLTEADFWAAFVVSCSGYGFICTVVGYIHGLRFNSNAYEEKYLLQLVRDATALQQTQTLLSLSAAPRSSSALSEEEFLRHGDPSMAATNASVAQSMVKRIHSLYILPHHILSVQFLDFFLARFVWLSVSCGASFVYYSVVFLHVWDARDSSLRRWLSGDSEHRLALWVSSLAVSLVSITWLCWLIVAVWRTGTLLRASRLATSRLRQISFRALTFQLTTGVLLFAAFAAYTVRETAVLHGVRLPSVTAVSIFVVGWLQYLGLGHTLLLSSSALALDSCELRVFVVCTALSLAYSLLPPSQLQMEQDRHLIVPLRCQLPTVASTGTRQEPFCLELACQLLEVSYQTYFASEDALRRPAASDEASTAAIDVPSSGQPRMDLRRLGLSVWASFVCPLHATFGLVGCQPQLRRGSTPSYGADVVSDDDDVAAAAEHVVAFRGSTLANIAADFYFALMPLPSLKRTRRFIRQALSDGNGAAVQETDDTATPLIANESTDEDEDEDDVVEDDWLRKTTESVPLLNEHFPRVHIGFWHSYASLRDEFLRAEISLLQELYKRRRRRGTMPRDGTDASREAPLAGGYGAVRLDVDDDDDAAAAQLGRVLFTGHSLGAAMALLAALELAVNASRILYVLHQTLPPVDDDGSARATLLAPPQIVVYLYGCPRVGNAAFVELTRRWLPSTYRVQADGDIVTMVPKFLGFYRHAGCEVLLDDGAAGSAVVAPSILESSLFKRTTGNVANHSLDWYRRCLEACFEPEEWQQYLAQEERRCSLAPSHDDLV